MNILTLEIEPGTEFVVHIDKDLLITHVDDVLTELTSTSHDFFTGKNFYTTLFEMVEAPGECAVLGSLATGQGQIGVITCDAVSLLDVRCYPLPGPDGSTVGAVISCRIRNGIGKLPLDEDLLHRTMFQKYPDAIGIIDPETLTVIDCNDAALKQIGFIKEQLVGKPIHLFDFHKNESRVTRELQRVISAGCGELEVESVTSLGEKKNLHVQFNMIELDGRKLLRVITHDITGRKRAESELKKSEEQYRSLVEASPDIVMEIDLAGTVLYVNRVLKGNSNDDAIGSNYLDFLPADEHKRVRKLLNRSLSRRRNTEFEISVVTPFGTRWWNTRALPQEKDGIINRFLLITTDVTGTKRAQDGLKLSEERYRNLVEKSPLPVVVHQYGFLKYVNPMAVKLFGIDKAGEISGKHIRDFIHPDDCEQVNRQFPTNYVLDEPTRTAEFRLLKPDGEIRDVRASAIVINFEGQLSRMLMLDDITERHHVEIELRHSEERYRNFVDFSPLPIFVHRDGYFEYVNNRGIELLGVDDTGELIGQSILNYVHDEDKDRIQEQISQLTHTNGTTQMLETRLVRKDGDVRDILISAISVNFEGVMARLVTVNDVTEQKNVERDLRASEQKFRFLTENMRDAVFHMDMNFIHQYISPSIEKIRGFTVDDIIDLPIHDSLPPESLENAQKMLTSSIECNAVDENGEPLSFMFEQEEYCKDGSRVWTEISAGFIYDDDKKPVGIIGCTRDISERKEREKLIQRQQKSLQQIVELNPYPIVVLDKDGYLESHNKAFYDLCSSNPPKEHIFFEDPLVIGLGHNDLMIKARNGEMVKFPEVEYNPSHVYPNAPDVTIYIEVTSFPIRNAGGEIENYVIMYHDVTERRLAEAEVRNAEERYRKIVYNIPVGIVMYRDGEFVFANTTALNSLVDSDAGKIYGADISDVIYKDDLDFVRDKMEKVAGQPDVVSRLTHRIKTVDGVKWIEATTLYIEESGQPVNIIFFREIEEPENGRSFEIIK